MMNGSKPRVSDHSPNCGIQRAVRPRSWSPVSSAGIITGLEGGISPNASRTSLPDFPGRCFAGAMRRSTEAADISALPGREYHTRAMLPHGLAVVLTRKTARTVTSKASPNANVCAGAVLARYPSR